MKTAFSASAVFSGCVEICPSFFTLVSPVGGVIVSQHNFLHKRYLDMPRAERVAYFADQSMRYEMKSADQYPVPIEFVWECADPQLRDFTLVLSESPDLSSPVATSSVQGTSAQLDNLKLHTDYYWCVSATVKGTTICSEAGHFRTEDLAPRLFRIEKIPNVRDLGGRPGMRGKRVRQNLLFRTAGLNDNASDLYYTAEEMKHMPEYAELYATKKSRAEELQQTIEKCQLWLQQTESNPDAIQVLEPVTSREWVAFRPTREAVNAVDHEQLLADMTSIPAEFLGTQPEKALMNEKGYFTFPIIDQDAPSVFMQEFDSPADGFLQLGCGADWYWEMRVNQFLIYDKRAGNYRSPVAANNFRLQIPVRAGRNLLTVLVFSGAGSWSWCCAPLPATPSADILNSMIKHLTAAGTDLWKVVKDRKAGVNRLTPDTKKYLLADLGVKTDLDLRNERECWGMHESPLGPEVEWIRISSKSYAAMQSEEGREAFVETFKVFLDATKYPIIFHCIGGQDRTGAVAFILNGLLGVEEEELYLDWEVSGFWNQNAAFRHEHLFDKLVEGFMQWPGKNINEKIEQYVLSLGFTNEDIEKFRTMMLE